MIALHFRLSLDSGFNANFLHVVVNALEHFMMNGIRFFPIGWMWVGAYLPFFLVGINDQLREVDAFLDKALIASGFAD